MPLVESMLSVIRSNKAIMLDKSKRFRKTLGGYDKVKGQQFNFPKASPEQLQILRERIKKRQNQIRKKRLLTFLLILIVLYFLFVYK
ncbi:hypothetical protein [Aestuariivivens sp. NBU2969]|uniref:hypothetical protein n=1 Tax=Aestuariivivens sp. NBU2969 TaxID=2873267 RepID=UPI001CBBF7EF|nr:hypothetical protein [Aestuariivivens sp. NBU2969]